MQGQTSNLSNFFFFFKKEEEEEELLRSQALQRFGGDFYEIQNKNKF